MNHLRKWNIHIWLDEIHSIQRPQRYTKWKILHVFPAKLSLINETIDYEHVEILITDHKTSFMTNPKFSEHVLQKNSDHWSRKILGWRHDFLRWEQLWPEAPILKPSRISWNGSIRNQQIHHLHNYPETEPWETVNTPLTRKHIKPKVKMNNSSRF